MARRYYVYILVSNGKTLCVGMTAFLIARVLRHRAQGGKSRLFRLVYYEAFLQEKDATQREMEIKNWRREKKVALINKKNPSWEDLAAGWGDPDEALLTTDG